MATFPYQAVRFGTGRERVILEAQSMQGGYGQTMLEFPVQHCLGGTWQDEDRVLRISPPYGSSFTAEVTSGTLCEETGGIAFSGTIGGRGDEVSGSDLKACNPQECVDAGLLPKSVTFPFSGTIADDGQSVTIRWSGTFYDIETDNDGKVVACTESSTQENTFTISRLSWDAR